jgi:hypothetical protein
LEDVFGDLKDATGMEIVITGVEHSTVVVEYMEEKGAKDRGSISNEEKK